MTRILTIFTGGTIGSSISDGYVRPSEKAIENLIDSYESTHYNFDEIAFDVVTPYVTLSENLNGLHMQALGNCLDDGISPKHDGVIICHGTDTLQYSAAMIAYHQAMNMPGVNIPIVFVSSNYVLSDERANGLDNFSAAASFIQQYRGKGTFVAYKNSNGGTFIHEATRVLPHLPYSDDIRSMFNKPFAEMVKGRLRIGEMPLRPTANDATFKLSLPTAPESGILRIPSTPGAVLPHLSPVMMPKAIIIDAYHSGTVDTNSKPFQEFCDYARMFGIPMFVSCVNNEIDYESVEKWDGLGLVSLPQASPIAMYCKLWMAISGGNDGDALKAILSYPIADEIV